MSTFRPADYAEAKLVFRPLKRSPMARTSNMARNGAVPTRNSDTGSGLDRTPIASQGFTGRRTAINKRGPKTKAWDVARAWLHRQFRLKGIHTCQIRFPGCWFDREVFFAHPAKRRNLKEGELYVAAKACNPCHDRLEVMAPERMRSIVVAAFNSTGIVRKQIP